jgi:hypothetical protein
MKKLLIIWFLVGALTAQVTQQEFLNPSKVRKKYKLKEFQTILYADDEVFKDDPSKLNKEFVETSGYRIQLISTQNLAEAISVKAKADSLYSMPVYVDFEPPNYKVRIGNYETNEEAMSMQNAMQNHGFKNAWVVPSKIVVAK